MAINLKKWIEENKDDFRPPIGNKNLYNLQLMVFFVGGPNARKDFHLEVGEEFFYMRKGDMNLPIIEKGVLRDISIKEGEVFLLPCEIPHSPQRKENTIGLVIERLRDENELDCTRWYTEDFSQVMYESWFHCSDLSTELPLVFKKFYESEQYKTGKPIPGTIPDNPPIKPNMTTEVEKPFCLKQWIQDHYKEINKKEGASLFRDEYQTKATIYGQGESEFCRKCDTFLWQLEGSSDVIVDGQNLNLTEDSTFLVQANHRCSIRRPIGCLIMEVMMNPRDKQK